MWILARSVAEPVNGSWPDAPSLAQRAAVHPQDVLSFPSAAARGHAPAGLLGVLPSSEIFKTARGNGLPLAGVHAASLLSFALSLRCPPRCAQLQSYEGWCHGSQAAPHACAGLLPAGSARPGCVSGLTWWGRMGMLRPQGCSLQGLDLQLSSLDPGCVSQELSGAVHSSSSSPQAAKAASLLCGAAPATKHGHICAFCLGAGSRVMLGPPPP